MNSIQYISSQVERVRGTERAEPAQSEPGPGRQEAAERWWWVFPISTLIRFFTYVYAAFASTLVNDDKEGWTDIEGSIDMAEDIEDRVVYRHTAEASMPSILNESTEQCEQTESARGRSVRIRLAKPTQLRPSRSSGSSSDEASSLKSPTSPVLRTKYPRTNPPPRPLLSKHASPKTLILDLDETLIHSMSKGGKTGSGHMVEVKLDNQHAILYYVHKRPYCDEFLRKIAEWYNLVIFTASVQEYADPVIDWLEQDRKLFRARYYRQHCTFRNGGYVKDISVVEPNLTKVMILDNSPISYYLHEDNAIAIEGWINDPSDLDLLHLVPFLNGMRYVTDVRSLISLRMGESAFEHELAVRE